MSDDHKDDVRRDLQLDGATYSEADVQWLAALLSGDLFRGHVAPVDGASEMVDDVLRFMLASGVNPTTLRAKLEGRMN